MSNSESRINVSKAKPKTRLLDWLREIILSFNKEPFTSADIMREWANFAPSRNKPTERELIGLLRNLIAHGFIERQEKSKKVAAISRGTYYVAMWREV